MLNSEPQIIASGWNLDPRLRYHFIGIAGVAMGNTAVDLKRCGFTVTGSDDGIYSPMKEILAEAGIEALTPFSPGNVDGADLVIVGNAISRGNPELEAVLNRRLKYTSLSEFIKHGLLQTRKNLVITGTHGKTTTTAIIAHLLQSAGIGPGYMIGGAPLNFPCGFSSQGTEWFAIEGDEYDIAFFDKRPKFLHYLPYAVVINNIEFDHADIYPDLDHILAEFRKLMRILPENGLLVINADDENVEKVVGDARCRIVSYGHKNEADFTGSLKNSELTVCKNGKLWLRSKFNLAGRHNLANALAASALLNGLGFEPQIIAKGFDTFKGVKRRMEFKGDCEGIIVFDDFAHHPTAIKISIEAVKETYPGRRVWAIFHPRSNTSVKNIHQAELIEALAPADCVVIAELHRKDKIPPAQRLSRESVRDELTVRGHQVFLWDTPDMILQNIKPLLQPGDIVLVMSNSAFGNLAEKLVRS